MIGNEDGIIEEEMIELCGSADINDLILYCRSLKKDVQHQIETKTALEKALQTEQSLRHTALRQLLDYSTEIKELREENHTLEMMAWEYENVWGWLMENADHTCKKLLILIEEWKEEDGLVTIDGVTYRKEMIE